VPPILRWAAVVRDNRDRKDSRAMMQPHRVGVRHRVGVLVAGAASAVLLLAAWLLSRAPGSASADLVAASRADRRTLTPRQ
jgi:hypothetical protein